MSGTYIPIRTVLAGRRTGHLGPLAMRFWAACVLGVLSVVMLGLAAHWLRWLLPAAAVLDLLVVVAAALWCGWWQAVVVSFAAIGVRSYFGWQLGMNPAADPAIYILLPAFLVTALVVSRLAARVREHAEESTLWRGQMEDLYEFTRQTLGMNLHVEPGVQLAELVHEVFGLEAVVIFDADLHQTYEAGFWSDDPREMAQSVYYFESSDDDAKTGISRRVLRLGTVPIGSLVMRGSTSELTNNAIASLIAITFDRYRALANEGRMEMERQTEQLRTTVLDALAHDYKTPLTAIRAASTGLAEMGKLSAGQSELVSLISEQADLLNELTTRLLTTARLDAEEVRLHAEPVGVAALIEEVVAGVGERLATMKVAIDVPDDELVLCCDRRLMTMLLTQYIDNACKYAIYGTTITIRAVLSKSEILFSVHSLGPVIPTADRERIFNRYYRSPNSSTRAPGTGIGLSVAKRAASIHGGHVWVASDEDEGNTFFAAIPAKARKRETP